MLTLEMTKKDHDSHCAARAKSGKRCRAAATAGGLCFFHANPNKASELGRVGGRRKRPSPEIVDPLPVVDSATVLSKALARLIADVHAGKVLPKVAASLAGLMNLQLRAIETVRLEQRVEMLELLLQELKLDKDLDRKKETVRLHVDKMQFLVRQWPREPVPDQGTKASSLVDSLNLNES
jgi:hypothetical protein